MKRPKFVQLSVMVTPEQLGPLQVDLAAKGYSFDLNFGPRPLAIVDMSDGKVNGSKAKAPKAPKATRKTFAVPGRLFFLKSLKEAPGGILEAKEIKQVFKDDGRAATSTASIFHDLSNDKFIKSLGNKKWSITALGSKHLESETHKRQQEKEQS